MVDKKPLVFKNGRFSQIDDADSLTFSNGIVAPADSASFSITYAQHTTGAGNDLTISGQQGNAGSNGGDLFLKSGAPGTSGVDTGGNINLDVGAINGSGSTGLVLLQGNAISYCVWYRNATGVHFDSSLYGQVLRITGTTTAVRSSSGSLTLDSTNGFYVFGAAAVANTFLFSANAASVSLAHTQDATAAGGDFTIIAQQGALTFNGGNLGLGWGLGGGDGGEAGNIWLGIAPSGWNNGEGILFLADNTTDPDTDPTDGAYLYVSSLDGYAYVRDEHGERILGDGAGGGSGDVTASLSIADNAWVTGDGGSKGIQGVDITVIAEGGAHSVTHAADGTSVTYEQTAHASGAGNTFTIKAQDAGGASAAGGVLSLQAGIRSGTASGGGIELNIGATGDTTNLTAVNFQRDNVGSPVEFLRIYPTGGASSQDTIIAALGQLNIQMLSAATASGNSINILGQAAGAGGTGGSIVLTAGAGNTTGNGGPVTITAGTSGATAGSVGGAITITAGTGDPGGDINISAGAGKAAGDDGGDVTLNVGDGGTPGTDAPGTFAVDLGTVVSNQSGRFNLQSSAGVNFSVRETGAATTSVRFGANDYGTGSTGAYNGNIEAFSLGITAISTSLVLSALAQDVYIDHGTSRQIYFREGTTVGLTMEARPTGAATLQWAAGATSVALSQANEVTSGGGADWSITAQTTTVAGQTGGDLTLKGGNGDPGGNVILSAGGGQASGDSGGDIQLLPGAKNGAATDGNIALMTGNATWNSMERGLFLGEALAAPTSDPSSGSYIWLETDGRIRERTAGGVEWDVTPEDTGGINGYDVTGTQVTSATSETVVASHTVSEDNVIIIATGSIGIRQTAGGGAGDSAGYVLKAVFKRISGTITQIGTTDVLATHEDQAGFNGTINHSGNDIRVTGTANATDSTTHRARLQLEIG